MKNLVFRNVKVEDNSFDVLTLTFSHMIRANDRHGRQAEPDEIPFIMFLLAESVYVNAEKKPVSFFEHLEFESHQEILDCLSIQLDKFNTTKFKGII